METVSLLAVNALNGGGGGGGDVTPDGITTEFNESEELQANAVIHVSALPSSNIKANTLYHVNETVTYTVDGDTETFTMSKFFRHESGAWVSYTTVSGLTQADYDHLTEAQKADGTNYIVNGGGRVTRMVYAALDGKPVLNDVTIDGSLTLEDINVYSIDEVDDLLAQKVAAEFVDQLPATMESNTWYYSKKFADGTDVPNDNRALYVLDADDVLQYMGVVGQVELDGYYTKGESDGRYYTKTDSDDRYYTQTDADAKFQEKITDSTVTSVSDTSFVSNTNAASKTNVRFSLATLWTWIASKLSSAVDRGLSVVDGKIGIDNTVTANSTSGLKFLTHNARGLITGSVAKTLGRGLSDSSNVIGHSNTAITAKTNNNVVGVQWDGYGHITGKGTEHSISSEYKTGASNQLFTRNGANALYSGVYNGNSNMVFCGNFTRNSTQSVSSNTSTRILLTGSDVYRSGLVQLSSNAIKILVAGTYQFRFCSRLADTGTTTRAWYLGGGSNSSMADDQMGGRWNYTYNRHKSEATYLKYCAAGEFIAPWVYVDSNSGNVNYMTVEVYKLNDK